MTLSRHVLHLLGAAIVMIAAYLVPAVAQAHEGHAHRTPAVASAVTVAPDLPMTTRAVPAVPVTPDTSTTLEHDTQAAAAKASVASPAPGRTASTQCNGLCCGLGMVCCAPALIPEAIAVLPGATVARASLPPPAPVLPGVDPEALPKPPRSFA